MTNTATILRLADRFLSSRSVHSIERTGDLRLFVLIVSICYACATASLVTLKDKFGFQKHASLSNLTIDFVIPEPIKDIQDKVIEQAKLSASSSASLGRNPVDRPISGPPIRPVLSQPKIQPDRGRQMAAPPVIVAQVKAPVAPVVVVKTREAPVQPNLITPPTAAAQSEAPVTSNSLTKETSIGNTQKENGAQGADATVGTQGGGAADNGKGAVGQQIAMATPHSAGIAAAMGNIAPYRKDMLMRLASHWNPKKMKQGNIVLVITLGKEGQLLNSEVLSSSGNDKLDQYALDAVGKTEFAPLPDWYRGSQLRLKVELARVEAMKSEI
jgi:TonB family protein